MKIKWKLMIGALSAIVLTIAAPLTVDLLGWKRRNSCKQNAATSAGNKVTPNDIASSNGYSFDPLTGAVESQSHGPLTPFTSCRRRNRRIHRTHGSVPPDLFAKFCNDDSASQAITVTDQPGSNDA